MADTTTSGETAVTTPTDADLIRIVQANANFKMTRAQNRKYFHAAADVPADNDVLTWDAGVADWRPATPASASAALLLDTTATTANDADYTALNQSATAKKLTRALNRANFTSGLPTVLDGDVLRYTDLPAAPTISSATVATPIVVTTSAPHGLTTGTTILISGATGMTELNATWLIVGLTDTTFSLINPVTLGNSVGANAYTGSGVISLPAGDWFPSNSRWRTILAPKYTVAAATSSTITVLSSLSDFANGLPIRVKQAGDYLYGIITDYTSTTVTIAGAALVASGNITELAVGTPEMITEVVFFLPGTYGSNDAATLTKLETNSCTIDGSTIKPSFIWRKPKAYLVTFSATHFSAPANAPRLSPRINGATVSTDGTGLGSGGTDAGPQMSTTSGTFAHNSAVGINASNYDINLNEKMELSFTPHSSGSAGGTNLTVICIFVFA